MSSSYQPLPMVIDPFVFHFLVSSIQPPPPLPPSIFFYDPFLVVPPPPPPTTTPVTTSPPPSNKLLVSNRHRYSPVQLYTLHRIFNQLPYPSLEQRRLIAQHLKIDGDQVRVWFSNRRSRKRFTSQPPCLIEPTRKEDSHSKELFAQLKLSI